jgi:hypothetical protein
VDGDSLQPSSETRFISEGFQFLKGLHKSFLQHIFSILAVVHHAETHVEHRFGIQLIELIPGFVAAFYTIGYQILMYECCLTQMLSFSVLLTKVFPKGCKCSNKFSFFPFSGSNLDIFAPYNLANPNITC